MPVKKPDEYQHNNPDLAFVDGNFVRGGRREPVANRAALYALASKADQLRAGSTIVRVLNDALATPTGSPSEQLLVDSANIGQPSGWQSGRIFRKGHWLSGMGKKCPGSGWTACRCSRSPAPS